MYYRIKLLDKDNINIFIKKIDCWFLKAKKDPLSLEGIVEFSEKTIKWNFIYTDKNPKLNEIESGWHDIYNNKMYEAIKEVFEECLDEKEEIDKNTYTKLKQLFESHDDDYKQALDIAKRDYEKQKEELFESYHADMKSVYEYYKTHSI